MLPETNKVRFYYVAEEKTYWKKHTNKVNNLSVSTDTDADKRDSPFPLSPTHPHLTKYE